MSDARAEVLQRVRNALGGGVAVPEVPRDYRGAGEPAPRYSRGTSGTDAPPPSALRTRFRTSAFASLTRPAPALRE